MSIPISQSAVLLGFAFCLLSSGIATAQSLPAPVVRTERPTLKSTEYGVWEHLGATTLSRDGKWVAYTITRNEGTSELRYRSLAAGADTRIVPAGGVPTFSASSQFLIYSLGYSEEELEKAPKDKPLRNKMGLVELATGKTVIVENIARFALSDEADFLALSTYPPLGRTSKVSDLIVRDLTTGQATTFGSVASFLWQKKGTLLAMALDAENATGNSVQVYSPTTSVLRTLDSSTETYSNLSWRKDADDLAFLRSSKDETHVLPTQAILVWQGLASAVPTKRVFDPRVAPGFPKERRVVDSSAPTFSDKGERLFFGVREWPIKPANTAKPSASEAGVEVWHSKDFLILPHQKKLAERERLRADRFAWNVASERAFPLGNGRLENVSLAPKGQQVALVVDGKPYQKEAMFGPDYEDLSRVDLVTGERKLLAQKIAFVSGLSTTGRYVLYFERNHYWAIDTTSGAKVNLTRNLPTHFENRDDDHTVAQKPPYGIAGWASDDSKVLLYDQFDLWEVKPDGTGGKRLTQGAAEQVIHRCIELDPDAVGIDLSKPLTLQLRGEISKKSGYGTLAPGKETVERLLWEERLLALLQRARDAETQVYTMEDADLPTRLMSGSQVLAQTNPQRMKYAWTSSELISFRSGQGKDLQGALYYPAGYERGKTYPMIVYIYEKLSQNVHGFSVPSDRNPYDTATFTQQGYFVFQPDIVYRDRNPGLSALDCITAGVQTVLKTGMIDPKRVGLVGHSWGAYQTTFLATQTNLFAACVAGAPLTDLVSMYLSIYWNSGGTDARIFEIAQGRMEVPPWLALKEYMANSPLFQIERMQTPLMIAFGNQDGAVDWHQGIEFYNAARRAEKQLVMLVYEGENHSLAKKPNQLDYHNRVLHWFDHYLKGVPAETWVTAGVPYREPKQP